MFAERCARDCCLMPCFSLDQEGELRVWNAGYDVAAQQGYHGYTIKKHAGEPLRATAFVNEK